MCGICGFVKNNGKIETGIIERMLEPLERRGPDDKGLFLDGARSPFCALGHRRLSIIDLETGHQPLPDESGQNLCVHNGEIYNFRELRTELEQKGYKFKTNSDTEVIADMYHAYGAGCVKSLSGMFAFAVWNKNERTLFLARDRVGIKPLYYYFDGENFLFSSSMKSFLALNFIKKEIDHEALSEYLQYLYINAPKSIFKQVKKLEPGSTLLLQNGKIAIEKYWSAPDVIKNARNNIVKDEKECIREIKYLLKDSVKKHLIADVPLGVFLSGGVDSSIITALASLSASGKIRTFSVVFKGEGYYDESAFARKVSMLFGTEHTEIEITPNVKDDLPKIVDFLDEPFADSSFIPTYYLSEFTRRYVKVALSGTGGDDIFAGYRRYLVGNAAGYLEKIPHFIRKTIESLANNITQGARSRIGEKAVLLKRFFAALDNDKEERHDVILSFINKDMQKELLKNNETNDKKGMLTELSEYFKGEPYVNRALYTDFISYLPGDLLVKEDRATMAVGLEGRVPFLDHRLVEYSFRVEPNLKVRGLRTKYILKKAFEDILPKEILYREKHGFAFPISEYLREGLKETARDILFSCPHDFFDTEAVEKLFNMHLEGKENLGQEIWALLVFNLWYEKNAK